VGFCWVRFGCSNCEPAWNLSCGELARRGICSRMKKSASSRWGVSASPSDNFLPVANLVRTHMHTCPLQEHASHWIPNPIYLHVWHCGRRVSRVPVGIDRLSKPVQRTLQDRVDPGAVQRWQNLLPVQLSRLECILHQDAGGEHQVSRLQLLFQSSCFSPQQLYLPINCKYPPPPQARTHTCCATKHLPSALSLS
jgi:hypothetical protein